jgi:hypothetical protein
LLSGSSIGGWRHAQCAQHVVQSPAGGHAPALRARPPASRERWSRPIPSVLCKTPPRRGRRGRQTPGWEDTQREQEALVGWSKRGLPPRRDGTLGPGKQTSAAPLHARCAPARAARHAPRRRHTARLRCLGRRPPPGCPASRSRPPRTGGRQSPPPRHTAPLGLSTAAQGNEGVSYA